MINTKALKYRIKYEMERKDYPAMDMAKLLGIGLSTWYWKLNNLEKAKLEDLHYIERALHTELITNTHLD